ncbi:hypothetical protein [Parabacteroides sp. PF5-6]|uniref:hypothetical protein n=1 Tax=Parabacteroides sp. PF5-6 TaxID=1742403 RepID=UPI0024057E80|nr:hypothetical protein [Parabacteroides sp. PF5-6]MDF9829144.1 hypothetical protein [Parabacteroides sp. PF5-6]
MKILLKSITLILLFSAISSYHLAAQTLLERKREEAKRIYTILDEDYAFFKGMDAPNATSNQNFNNGLVVKAVGIGDYQPYAMIHSKPLNDKEIVVYRTSDVLLQIGDLIFYPHKVYLLDGSTTASSEIKAKLIYENTNPVSNVSKFELEQERRQHELVRKEKRDRDRKIYNDELLDEIATFSVRGADRAFEYVKRIETPFSKSILSELKDRDLLAEENGNFLYTNAILIYAPMEYPKSHIENVLVFSEDLNNAYAIFPFALELEKDFGIDMQKDNYIVTSNSVYALSPKIEEKTDSTITYGISWLLIIQEEGFENIEEVTGYFIPQNKSIEMGIVNPESGVLSPDFRYCESYYLDDITGCYTVHRESFFKSQKMQITYLRYEIAGTEIYQIGAEYNTILDGRTSDDDVILIFKLPSHDDTDTWRVKNRDGSTTIRSVRYQEDSNQDIIILTTSVSIENDKTVVWDEYYQKGSGFIKTTVNGNEVKRRIE